MLGYGYGYQGWSMMGNFGIMGGLVCLVVLVDLVLVGIWLWQNISKK